nr:hypothetical protein [Pseudomonadota bacterium]
MSEESKTLVQLRDEMIKSRADQSKIGEMTINELKGMGGGLKDLLDDFKDGLKFDKKESADDKRQSKAEKEERREGRTELANALADLGTAFKKGFDNLDLTKPGGIGKILFGLAGLLTGVFVGFFNEIKNRLFLILKIFAYPFQKLFPKTIARLSNAWSKIFAKGGVFRNFLAFIKKTIRKVKRFFKPTVEILKSVFGFFGRIAGFLSPTLKTLGGSGGLITKTFKPMISTFKAMFKIGKVLGKTVGKIFLPIQIFWGVVKGLLGALDKFKSGDIIGGIGAFFGGILDVFTFGIIDIEKFTDWFSSLFGNFFGFFEKLFDGDIMGAITDLGNFLLDWFVGLPEMIFDGILNAIAGVFNFFGLDSIGKWFSDFADVDVLGTIKDFFGKMMMYIGPVMDGIWGAVKSVFGAIYDGFMWIWDNVYVPYIQFVGDLFMKIFSGIGTAFSWIYDNVFVPYISTLGDIMMSVFGGIGDALKWVYNNTVNPVISGIMYFFNMVGWAFGRVTNAGMHVLNGLIDLINSIPDWIKPASLEGLENFPVGDAAEFPSFEMLPGLKSGGMVEGLQDGLGKLFRMGEGGDEMVTPLDKLKPNIIDPILTKAMKMMPAMQNVAGGGGGGTSQVTVVHAPN